MERINYNSLRFNEFFDKLSPQNSGILFSILLHLIILLSAIGLPNFFPSKDIYVLDVNSGTRKQINKYYIPRPGDIIFVEEKVGFKRWDRVKDIISISASISSVLLVLNNVVGNN